MKALNIVSACICVLLLLPSIAAFATPCPRVAGMYCCPAGSADHACEEPTTVDTATAPDSLRCPMETFELWRDEGGAPVGYRALTVTASTVDRSFEADTYLSILFKNRTTPIDISLVYTLARLRC